MRLVSRASGQAIEVPDEQAQAAYQSGEFGLIPGTKLPVQLADGRTGTIDAEHADSAFKKGASLRTAADLAADQAAAEAQAAEHEHGVGLESLKQLQNLQLTQGEAVLRGLSFGLSDAAILGATDAIAGPKYREAARKSMEARKAVNPITSTVGEIAGAVVPMFIPGGQAAEAAEAAKAAQLAKGAVQLGELGTEAARVARGAEEVSAAGKALKAATSIPKGAEFAGNLAERAVKAAVGEGSENVVARMAQKALARGASDAVQAGLFSAGMQVSEDTLGDHETTGTKLAAAFGHGAMFGGLLGGGLGAAGEGLSTAGGALLKKAAPAARNVADGLVVKLLGGATKEMEHMPGGAEAVARTIQERGILAAGDTIETLAPKLRAAEESVAGTHKELLGIIDKSGGKGVAFDDLANEIKTATETKFGRLKEINQAAFDRTDELLSGLKRMAREDGTIGLSDLSSLRTELDSKINPKIWLGQAATPGAEAFADVRSILEKKIEAVGDQEAKRLALSEDFLKEYQDSKLTWRQLNAAATQAEKRANVVAKHSEFGLTDKMHMGMGLLHAISSGNPLAAVAGVGLGVVQKLARERGASTAAAILDKIGELGAIQKTVASVDGKVDGALQGFFQAKPAQVERFTDKATRRADYETAVRRVKVANTDPKAMGHLQATLASTLQHAPKVAQATLQTAGRAAAFLAGKVPPTPVSRSITPQHDTPKVSDADQEKFLKYVRAVDTPAHVLDDMAHGRLNRESVEALKQVYPALYKDVCVKALSMAASHDKPLKYDQKLQLGILLGAPTDASLQPDFIARMQANYQDGQKPGPQGGADRPKAPSRPIHNMEQSSQLGLFGAKRTHKR